MSSKPTDEDTTAYPKIPGPFIRDHLTNHLTDQWSSPELEATSGLVWRFTEKVDGMNIRVIWDGYRVTFAGRTLRAQLPGDLFAWLLERFGGPEREQLFEQKFGLSQVVLYGEGYGAGIQKGHAYRPDKSFVLFDVLVDGRWWLKPEDVCDVADYFGVEEIGTVVETTLADAVELMRRPLRSSYGDFPAEGLVGTTRAGLRARDGQRLIVKLKSRDLVQADA